MEDQRVLAMQDDLIERVSRNLGRLLFAARWIMAPIYLGLLVSLLLLAVKFVQKAVSAVSGILTLSTSDTIVTVLTLVDLALVGNLVLIVMLAGWENFVGPLLAIRGTGRPGSLATLDFGAVKLKLIASIVAIVGIQILETFVHIGDVPKQDALLQLGILLGVAVAGVFLALMDRLAAAGH
jgi:uncharacterized protein (TIGR00645 family)